jgi:hypothetical protein
MYLKDLFFHFRLFFHLLIETHKKYYRKIYIGILIIMLSIKLLMSMIFVLKDEKLMKKVIFPTSNNPNGYVGRN